LLAAGRADANGTMLRLRALHVMGHHAARIAAAIGAPSAVIQRITRGDAKTVTPALRDAVTGAYDAWWDKRAPGHTHTERAAATRARRRARQAGWCAPAALDDDLLDQPGYQPTCRWRPATGTGTRYPTLGTRAQNGRHRMITNPTSGPGDRDRAQASPGGGR
jgi:hypothetical protein